MTVRSTFPFSQHSSISTKGSFSKLPFSDHHFICTFHQERRKSSFYISHYFPAKTTIFIFLNTGVRYDAHTVFSINCDHQRKYISVFLICSRNSNRNLKTFQLLQHMQTVSVVQKPGRCPNFHRVIDHRRDFLQSSTIRHRLRLLAFDET